MVVSKRPTTVKVLHEVFAILYDKKLTDAYFLKEKDEVYGYVDFSTSTIGIDPTIPLSKIKETLLHEVQHICNNPLMRCIENPSEEQLVTGGTPILLGTLTDPSNKDFFDYVFGE